MTNLPLVARIDVPDPMLYCFIHCLFKPTSEGLKVSSWSATGSVICALTQSTNLKCSRPRNATTVDLVLPDLDRNKSLRRKFLCISPDDSEKILAILKREFHLTFVTYLFEGHLAGLKKKEIVERFIQEYQMGDIPSVFDRLSKSQQRKTKYAIRNFNKILRQKADDETKKAQKHIRKTM